MYCRKVSKIINCILLVFWLETALDFRYDARHRVSNLPCLKPKFCVKFANTYFIFIPFMFLAECTQGVKAWLMPR